MKEQSLIKKLDSETKKKLITILNSKNLDSDEIREEFGIVIDDYICDHDLEDYGIDFESLDLDELIMYFMQFLPVKESRIRRNLNENVATLDAFVDLLSNVVKDLKSVKDLDLKVLKFKSNPEGMTIPIKWNASRKDKGWIDLSNLKWHIKDL